jgi:hypothetical protein
MAFSMSWTSRQMNFWSRVPISGMASNPCSTVEGGGVDGGVDGGGGVDGEWFADAIGVEAAGIGDVSANPTGSASIEIP